MVLATSDHLRGNVPTIWELIVFWKPQISSNARKKFDFVSTLFVSPFVLDVGSCSTNNFFIHTSLLYEDQYSSSLIALV